MNGGLEVGGEKNGGPGTIYSSARKEEGTGPRSSGRLCGEELSCLNKSLKKFGCCRTVRGG